MGKLESEAAGIRRRGYVRNAVLATLGIAGVLAVALVAPNTLQLLRFTKVGKVGFQARTALARLVKQGRVEFIIIRGKKCARLTQSGKRMLLLEEERVRMLKPRKWDGSYQIVIFDLPERRKTVRDRLRRKMASYGFLRIQDSVWLYPYDCEELIVLLKAELKIGKDVLYAVVTRIENDLWIRKHFKLPLP